PAASPPAANPTPPATAAPAPPAAENPTPPPTPWPTDPSGVVPPSSSPPPAESRGSPPPTPPPQAPPPATEPSPNQPPTPPKPTPPRVSPRAELPPPAGTPCPKDPITPVVSIKVRAPACVAQGQPVTYKICVENHARAPAHHVTVRNPLPTNARFVRATPEPSARDPELVWHFGTLEPCACREITLVLEPTGSGDVRNCARVQFEHGQCVTTRIARPTIRVRKCGPSQAILYDALTYQIEVTNTGASPIKDIVVTDTLPEGLQDKDGRLHLRWTIDSLAPGQCRCIEYQVLAVKVGRHCNRAEVRAGDLLERAECCVTVTEPKLELKKTGPAYCYSNQAALYRLTVSNPGTAALTNVVVSDPLPPKTTLVRASHGGQLQGDQVRWKIGTLAAGASRTVELLLKPEGAGKVCNRATATADRGLTASSEVCTEFAGTAAFLLQIDDTGSDPLEVGAEGRYVITVRNTGHEPAAGVQITAILPEQMPFTAAKGPTQFVQQGQRVIFEPMTIAAGSQATFEVRGKAVKPADARFRVELRAAQLDPERPVISEESTTIYADLPPNTRLQPPQDLPP
ncbi:MAG: DUF11 domain-containing protein, partial [Gemmataceae bacterium]|nr:DUF11 domain-containing protein [Gemmataceae bacterium]